jgi:hypothetical protein
MAFQTMITGAYVVVLLPAFVTTVPKQPEKWSRLREKRMA